MDILSVGMFRLVQDVNSLTLVALMAGTIFFFLSRSQVQHAYKTALTVCGLVTFIAAYHYVQIMASWTEAYTVIDGAVVETGVPFNRLLHYSNWLLTVPMLLVGLILVMNLGTKETSQKSLRLGGLAALMIALGYPGEIATTETARLFWGVASMIPFIWILYELFFGLKQAINKQPAKARILVTIAIWMTLTTWMIYPLVYFFGGAEADNATFVAVVQIGYALSDIVAKVGYGILIYAIAMRKSEADMASADLSKLQPVAAPAFARSA